MTIGSCLLYIHYTEFSQQRADDFLMAQHQQLMTDSLTGVKSRVAYSGVLKRYRELNILPDQFAAVTIDLNGLKDVNDTLGHEAGDEMICGAADCIRAVYQADCYRTGGDEFVVLLEGDKQYLDDRLKELREKAASWKGEKVKGLSIAAGCASLADHPGLTAEQVVRESDFAMYAAKTTYYEMTGRDRRKHC